ncbi:unnamed protein product [Polarella glacialis]|uniref:Uncharacterized protein n=1 Tax=Polarella glacialis TaxID=89957 RepID=A0A813F659_POLGL|nr:unnamed protein product [Polarella glacialis]
MNFFKMRPLEFLGADERGLDEMDKYEISPEEEAEMKSGLDWVFSKNIARFAAWRSARLRVAMIPFFLSNLIVLLTSVGVLPSAADMITQQLGAKYVPYFASLTLMCKIERYCMLLGGLSAWILALLALGYWGGVRFDLQSVIRVRWCVCLNVVLPFFLVLFIPFRQGLQVLDFRKEMCLDLVESIKDDTQQFLDGEFLLQSLFRHAIQFDSLQRKVCYSKPAEWGESVLNYIVVSDHFSIQDQCHQRTVTRTGVQHGPAVTAQRILMESSGSIASAEDLVGCASRCEMAASCKGSCPKFLAPLGMMVSIHGQDAVAKDDFAMLGPSTSSCSSCFTETLELDCIQKCFSSRRLADRSRVCVTRSEIEDLQLIANLGPVVSLERIFLGVFFGLKSFVVLLPLALAIITGIMQGGNNAHSFLPQSRFPAFISLTVSTTNLPFVLVVLAFLQNVAGDTLTGISIAFFVMNYIMSTKFWRSLPVSTSMRTFLDEPSVIWVVRILMIAFLAAGILLHSATWHCTRLIIRFIQTAEFSVVTKVILSLRSFLAWSVLNFILVYFGQAMILGVFFADTFVALTYHFQQYEAKQDEATRVALWEEVECLRTVLESNDPHSTPRLTVFEALGLGGFGRNPLSWFFCRPVNQQRSLVDTRDVNEE